MNEVNIRTTTIADGRYVNISDLVSFLSCMETVLHKAGAVHLTPAETIAELKMGLIEKLML